MPTKKTKQNIDTSTEEKIKNAARTVFHKNGFAATRTRDIAEEAGINLALLNYYFRSKEKLFDIIMLETMQGFFKSLKEIYNDDKTSIEAKIDTLINNYINLLIKNPEIPLFLLNELKSNPEELIAKMGVREIIMNSHFMKQLQKEGIIGKNQPIHHIHFMMNIMGITLFPFIGRPLIKAVGNFSDAEFTKLMEERKLLIPKWIKSMIKTK